MADPVDQASFGQLVARFSALLEEWRSVLRRVQVQELSGPGPWMLTEAEHGGKSLLVSNGAAAGAITLKLPAAEVGVLFLADQAGPAPIKLVPSGGDVLRHRLGHTGTAGQWASLHAKCIRPGEWLLVGDTATVA